MAVSGASVRRAEALLEVPGDGCSTRTEIAAAANPEHGWLSVLLLEWLRRQAVPPETRTHLHRGGCCWARLCGFLNHGQPLPHQAVM